jgi:hypothetical protein
VANRSGCGAEEEGKTAAGRQAGRGVAAGEACEGQRIMYRPAEGRILPEGGEEGSMFEPKQITEPLQSMPCTALLLHCTITLHICITTLLHYYTTTLHTTTLLYYYTTQYNITIQYYNTMQYCTHSSVLGMGTVLYCTVLYCTAYCITLYVTLL